MAIDCSVSAINIFECFKMGFIKDLIFDVPMGHFYIVSLVSPIFARIVAVADVYDALTSDRSYRKAWVHHEAMKYLKENKGTHFDPQCVEAWDRLCLRDPSVYQIPLQAVKDETIIKRLSSFQSLLKMVSGPIITL